jgi:hypothetical protein
LPDQIFRDGFENAIAAKAINTTVATRYAYLQSKLIAKVENGPIVAH